ncbi:hypothetical protein FJW07_31525 [Mesorhizobium sp. B3-1-9]|nr:hypothetical protein FJW07_31525 [Mesorhizobium sp. B3-1-9]
MVDSIPIHPMRFSGRSNRTRIGSDQNSGSGRRRPIEDRQAAYSTISALSICEATGTQKPAEFKLNRLILFRTWLGTGLGIGVSRFNVLKRVALKRIQATRFGFVFMHVVIAKPLHTFARHAFVGPSSKRASHSAPMWRE